MNITLGSLRERDLLALEDLELLPEAVELAHEGVRRADQTEQSVAENMAPAESTAVTPSRGDDLAHGSSSGTTGGISWFENMIQGSQLGYHSKRRKGHGTSADGTTTISWEISEYYGGDDEGAQTPTTAKRKAGDIETDDTAMDD